MQCDLLLYGGKVVAETGTLPRGYVAVDGGRIISIGENWQGIEAKKYLDVSSYLVVPGGSVLYFCVTFGKQ